MVNAVPPAETRKFLAAELRKDPALLERYAAVFSRTQRAKGTADYRARVQDRMDRAKGRKGYIDRFDAPKITFTDILKDARASEKIGDYVGAARIYAEASEAILHNLPWVQSKIGRFHGPAGRFIENMGACATRARTAADRRKILAYLLRGWVSNTEWSDYDYKRAVAKGAADLGEVRFLIDMFDDGVQPVYKARHGDKDYEAERLRDIRRELAKITKGERW